MSLPRLGTLRRSPTLHYPMLREDERWSPTSGAAGLSLGSRVRQPEGAHPLCLATSQSTPSERGGPTPLNLAMDYPQPPPLQYVIPGLRSADGQRAYSGVHQGGELPRSEAQNGQVVAPPAPRAIPIGYPNVWWLVAVPVFLYPSGCAYTGVQVHRVALFSAIFGSPSPPQQRNCFSPHLTSQVQYTYVARLRTPSPRSSLVLPAVFL